MQYPKFIKENSCIGIPAPSDGAIDSYKKNKYKQAKKYLESIGYKIILSNNLFKSKKGRSASAETRGKEINEMFSKEEIDLILCAAGGEFLVEILPYVNFELLKKKIKYVVGFSDPTGLLYPITTKYDIATIYGSNFSNLGVDNFDESHYDFLKVLKGEKTKVNSYELYEIESFEKITGREGNNLTEKVYWKTLDNKKVDIKGRIIGGCFDIIAELAGTKYDGIDTFNEKYKKDGIIWYFDNCEQSMEETIRILWKMNELGYFKYAKGIIFGRFGSNRTTYEYTTKTCLEDSVLPKLKIPIIYDADVSHLPPSITIINGSIAHVICDKGKASISYELK